MANARQRIKDRRASRKAFHLRRLETAPSLVEKLEVAFGLFRAELINTSNTERAQAIGLETLNHLIAQSDRIPRSL